MRQPSPARLPLRLLRPFVLAVGFACLAPAQAAFQAVRLPEGQAIRLDGRLDEAAWAQAPVHDRFWQTQPFDGVAAPVKTEVRVVYDRRYLYVAVKSFDPSPGQIRAPFGRRDTLSGDQDFIGLFIDPSGASKSAQTFYVNARGAITDGVYSGTNGDDYAPDHEFDVATGRFDGGWIAEVRIPFSSIAFDASQSTPWKLLVMRSMSRDQRYRMYSGAVTRATSCNLCYSDEIAGLRELPTGLTWSATPQLVLGRRTEDVAGQPRQRTDSHDLSLDVKLRPDSATIVDATINPDFSQVELNAPQLSGNTRFGLFVDEKRPFFLEGSDIFQMPFRAVNTRTISDPSWGLRYTRRTAGSDLTVLTTRDAGGGLVMLPHAYYTGFAPQDMASKATVARATWKAGTLAIGGLFSDRLYADGRGYNRVAGADAVWQRTDTERLRGQLLLSTTTALPGADGTLAAGDARRGHALYVDWVREDPAWVYEGGVESIGEDFRDDNGFFTQAGYRYARAMVTRKMGQRGMFNEWNLYAGTERMVDGRGDIVFDDPVVGTWAAGPLDSEVNFQIKPVSRSRVAEGGELFRLVRVGFRIEGSPGRVLARAKLKGEVGDVVDVEGARVGRGGTLTLSGRLRPSDRFELEPTWSANWIAGKEGSIDGRRLYTEQAAQLNGIFHAGPHDTLRVILQQARTRRDAALYPVAVTPESRSGTVSVVYGHTPSLGNAAYVGLTASTSDVPGQVPKRDVRELFVKLSFRI